MARQRTGPRVLRRGRPPPRAQPRRVRVAGVQRDGHRLGAPALLREDLIGDPGPFDSPLLRPVKQGNTFEQTVERLASAIRLGVVETGPAPAGRTGSRRAARRQPGDVAGGDQGAPAGRLCRRRCGDGPAARSWCTTRGDARRPTRAAWLGRSAATRCSTRWRSARWSSLAPPSWPPRDVSRKPTGIACAPRSTRRRTASPPRDGSATPGSTCWSANCPQSPSLAAAVADVQRRLDGLLAAIPVFERNIAHSDAQHARITRAVLRGQPAMARTVMAEHVEATAALLRGLLT